MTAVSPIPSALPNRSYYLQFGPGRWKGKFSFHLTDWAEFRRDRIGVMNRFLVLMMVGWQTILGDSTISSDLVGFATNDRASNLVRIHKFGITLYVLKEEYLLHQDGTNVTVVSWERFGPIPGLFENRKNHPAEIHSGGMSSTYYMPLLGTAWIGQYQISSDRDHVNARLNASWGYSEEIISRVKS